MDHLISTMWILIILIALIAPLRATDKHLREQYQDLWIDCGANKSNDNIRWELDEQFIKTGEVKLLPSNYTQFQMNTLRYFPKGRKNCYKLPFDANLRKYIFRVAFLYGNYDSLSKPPSFGLEIDGHFWTNVTTSMSDEPVYHELLYIIPQEQVTICLVQTIADQVPFISSLQAEYMYDPEWYTFMKNNTAFNLHSRINYGANQSVEQGINADNSHDDPLPRTWASQEMSNYLNIHSTITPFGYLEGENCPPDAVMFNAIQAINLTDSLYLPIDFSSQTSTSSQVYFVLYFMDPILRKNLSNETCTVEIYIDRKKMGIADVPNFYTHDEIPKPDEYRVISLFPVTIGNSANVTISAAENSTLAPILNAMEIYWKMDVSKARFKMHTTKFYN